MAIVEYAKYGNLRDYLRNKRIHSYFVFNLQRNITVKNQISNLLTLLSSSTSSHDKEDESIDFRDLVNFAYQVALGMDYLHSKKVGWILKERKKITLKINLSCCIAISPQEMS